MFNPQTIFRPVIETGLITIILTIGAFMLEPVHPCDKYEFGPWALNGLPEDRRVKYATNCGAPEAPPGYAWGEDYLLIPER